MVRVWSRLAVVVRDSADAITVQDFEGRIMAWNPGAEKMYGWSEAEALEMNIRNLIPEGLRDESQARRQPLSGSEILEPYHTKHIARDGRIVEVVMTATVLADNSGRAYAISTIAREIGQTEI